MLDILDVVYIYVAVPVHLDGLIFMFSLLQVKKDSRHFKTYKFAFKDKAFVEGPWSQNNLDNGANLLIPVSPPLCGVIIIGEETIVYCSANAFKAIPIRPVRNTLCCC